MTQKFQLALNVDNIDTAVEYYSKLYGVTIKKPPLKLVLFEKPGAAKRINHLGVENFDQADVDDAIERFKCAGISDEEEVAETCSYATQNKIWSTDPSGTRWEWYHILEDA